MDRVNHRNPPAGRVSKEGETYKCIVNVNQVGVSIWFPPTSAAQWLTETSGRISCNKQPSWRRDKFDFEAHIGQVECQSSCESLHTVPPKGPLQEYLHSRFAIRANH